MDGQLHIEDILRITLMMKIMLKKINLEFGVETFLSLVNGEKKIENNLKKLIFGVGLDLF